MSRQHAFTIVTDLVEDPHQVGELAQLLDDIGCDVMGDPHLRLSELDDLHYASLCLVGGERHGRFLLFEGNVDGPVDAFLAQLVDRAPGAVDAIYGRCAGYPAPGDRSPDAVVAYLRAHDLGSNAFYVAWPGRTVEEIRREEALHQRIEELLDQLDPALAEGGPAVAIHRWVGEQVRARPDLAWASTPAPVPFLVRHGMAVLVAALAPLVLALVALVATALGAGPARRRRPARAGAAGLGAAVAAVAVGLRRAEAADERRERDRCPGWKTAYAGWSGQLGDIRQREDHQLQNHMISVTDITASRFRRTALGLVLWVIDVVARLKQNKGSLGGIPTIHFARWVVTRDRTRLVFLSNFDGSWERYLNDFIDQEAMGLTAVWTHTDNEVGFPRTRWLLGGGARDEVRFKAFARASMTPTQVWYSAYPSLTVEHIADNMAIRRDLFAPLDEDGARAWLRRL